MRIPLFAILVLAAVAPCGLASAQSRPQGFYDTWNMARETPTDISRRARDEAEAVGDLEADRLAAEEDAAIAGLQSRAGAEVMSDRGVALGRLIGVAEHADTGEPFALIQGQNDVVRLVRASVVSIDEAGGLLADMTAYEFRRQPELPRDPG